MVYGPRLARLLKLVTLPAIRTFAQFGLGFASGVPCSQLHDLAALTSSKAP